MGSATGCINTSEVVKNINHAADMIKGIEAKTEMIPYQLRKVYLPGIDACEERLWDPLLVHQPQ